MTEQNGLGLDGWAAYEPEAKIPVADDTPAIYSPEINGLYNPHGMGDEPAKTNRQSQKGRAKAPAEILPYVPFPVEALPSAISLFVSEASSAIGCDASFVALPILAGLSRAIGNKRVIRLKRTWTEPAIIWGAIVGKSGSHKSPALQAAMAVLVRKQNEAIARHVEALQKFEQEQANYQRDFAAWKRTKSTEPPPWEPKEPACERFIVSDITIEALADRLSDQFDGVLVVRDELASWVDGIAEYKGGKGSDTGHWLASWSAAPWTVDRKTGREENDLRTPLGG